MRIGGLLCRFSITAAAGLFMFMNAVALSESAPTGDGAIRALLGEAKACTGCCSSHGGVSSSCSGGNILCNDGTRSPSCGCGSCSSGGGSMPSTCSYTYTPWSACQPGGFETRIVISSSPFGCTGNPVLTQYCAYLPPPPVCSYSYSEWSACQTNGAQTRSVISVGPSGCAGLPEALTQACTYSTPIGSVNYTALWWNPAESGWGLNVNQQDQTIFATLFMYDSTGAPMWLVASDMTRQVDNSFEGALYQVTGPAFNQTPWGGVVVSQVGQMELSFTGDDVGTLDYSVGTTSIKKLIQKQVFETLPVCTGTTTSRATAVNYQDLWWNPQESGWGINLTHQGDIIFATLFTYNAAGRGVWLVASSMARQADGGFSGTLYSVKGPAFGTEWTSVTPTAVGIMSAKFSSGEAGALTYTFNGVTVTKPIRRQVFGRVVPICQ